MGSCCCRHRRFNNNTVIEPFIRESDSSLNATEEVINIIYGYDEYINNLCFDDKNTTTNNLEKSTTISTSMTSINDMSSSISSRESVLSERYGTPMTS